MLEFRHLHTLVALREHGSLAAASEELHVTASALSHQLKELENYYGVLLVNRKTRPMAFTPAGEVVLALADNILPKIANSKANIRRLADGQLGRLRLASECHSCFDWLMPILNQYRKHWPDVELDFATGFEPDPHDMLAASEIDFLITSSNISHTELVYHPIFTYESRLVVAPTHPLAQKSYITPADLADQTLIAYPVEPARLDVIDKFLAPANVSPANIRTTELTMMLIQLVASERGVAALPDWVITEYENKGWVVSKTLGEPVQRKSSQPTKQGIHCQLYAATRSSDADTAFVQGFLQLLLAYAKK